MKTELANRRTFFKKALGFLGFLFLLPSRTLAGFGDMLGGMIGGGGGDLAGKATSFSSNLGRGTQMLLKAQSRANLAVGKKEEADAAWAAAETFKTEGVAKRSYETASEGVNKWAVSPEDLQAAKGAEAGVHMGTAWIFASVAAFFDGRAALVASELSQAVASNPTAFATPSMLNAGQAAVAAVSALPDQIEQGKNLIVATSKYMEDNNVTLPSNDDKAQILEKELGSDGKDAAMAAFA